MRLKHKTPAELVKEIAQLPVKDRPPGYECAYLFMSGRHSMAEFWNTCTQSAWMTWYILRYMPEVDEVTLIGLATDFADHVAPTSVKARKGERAKVARVAATCAASASELGRNVLGLTAAYACAAASSPVMESHWQCNAMRSTLTQLGLEL